MFSRYDIHDLDLPDSVYDLFVECYDYEFYCPSCGCLMDSYVLDFPFHVNVICPCCHVGFHYESFDSFIDLLSSFYGKPYDLFRFRYQNDK